MATFQKRGDSWRALVRRGGVARSRTFLRKADAIAWAAGEESASRAASEGRVPDKTFADLLIRYRDEVSVGKDGARWEAVRINTFLRAPMAGKRLTALTSDTFSLWRNERSKQVSAGTVAREMNLLSAICSHAAREWHWLLKNPVALVRRPPTTPHRDRVISRWEIRAMLRELGYSPAGSVETQSQSVAACFLLALRTGMRSGEICNLTWANVHDGFCYLPKTETKPRKVPLSRKAMAVIEKMRGRDATLVFALPAGSRDTLFRRSREEAGMRGFTFHDSRHTAATWMAKKVDVLTLCKIFGWSDPKMAMVYYNPSVTDIARQLD